MWCNSSVDAPKLPQPYVSTVAANTQPITKAVNVTLNRGGSALIRRRPRKKTRRAATHRPWLLICQKRPRNTIKAKHRQRLQNLGRIDRNPPPKETPTRKREGLETPT
ncbi:hypothetical protein QE152_g26036 [Popillia japonica]|uniref:Uncharacterized protein n=1 Tax=Popillia japonica TaxID=7064 RepID=A0AAW1K0J2_POPJA